MLTLKGLDKIGNGELEDYYLRGKLEIIFTTKKGKWFRNEVTIEYKLLDIDTNDLLANEIHTFRLRIGDSFTVGLPDIKKKVILSAE